MRTSHWAQLFSEVTACHAWRIRQSQRLFHCTPISSPCWNVSDPAHSRCASLMHLPLQRIQSAITPGLAAALSHQGWAVADQVLGSNAALCILDEVRGLQDSMHLNSTHLVKSQGRQLLEKSHIHEAELFDQASACDQLSKRLCLPCVLLSASSCLLQHWTAAAAAAKSPSVSYTGVCPHQIPDTCCNDGLQGTPVL